MSNPEFEFIKMSMVGDVAVVEVLAKELRFPNQAEELSYELGLVVAQEWAAKTLVNLSRTHFIGSTAFAVFFRLVAKAKEQARSVKFCGLSEDVRIGADIIGLDKLAEIYDTEDEALESFTQNPNAPAFES
ncbi:MAG: STAS domain-containing protein [Paludisphaera borealis]|uniref:STAS domain-containing protein n=1 Tax=Paludisphaera borealis TaxID=1387353 RepID=UPI00283F0F74|nr:STAS domain-containing protein [Paludisphaera borealis]MDR3620542.1 STAS domain-containing protein [Paludisphaera borealis]